MNWNSLSELHSNLKEFDQSMAYKDSIEGFYKNINNYKLKKSASDQVKKLMAMFRHDRQFEYNSFVITLYGFLELFIESMIGEYVDELRKLVKSYSGLDNKTKDHYRREMIAMYNRRKTPKLAHLTDAIVSENLYQILFSDCPKLMPEAFFQSGGNYNFEEITNSFKALGCSNIKSDIKLYDPLRSYFISTGASPNETDAELYQKLNDLVSRRNEIAHGSNKGNILSKTIIKQYKDFIRVFCESLASYLSDNILRLRWNTLTYEARCSHMFNNNRAQIKGEFLIFIGMKVIQRRNGMKPEFIENTINNVFVNGTEVTECLCEKEIDDVVVAQLECSASRGNLLRFE